MKQRRLEATSSIPQETELLRRFPARIRKEEYLEFLGLSTSSKLSLDQGKFVRDKRLAELGLRMSRETPGDGSCMFHALLDQIKSNPSLPDYAENHWELRYKLEDSSGPHQGSGYCSWINARLSIDITVIMTNYNDTISVSEYYYCMSSGSEGSVGGKTVPTDREVVPRSSC